MVTQKGTSTVLVELLQDLIQIDYDAIEAYEAAIDRVDSFNLKPALREFLADHQRHIRELSAMVSAEGFDPPTKGDYKRVLTKGKVVLADLAGDRAILTAMRSNEDQTVKAYEKACDHQGLEPVVLTTLQANLADERRHRAWFEQQLGNR